MKNGLSREHSTFFLTALVILIFIFPLITGSAVYAAQVFSSQKENCDVELVGEIETGDLQKLQAEVNLSKERNREDGFDPYVTRLCLDSPGGSFAEADKIIELMTWDSVGTVVDSEASCLSACALIFMAGRFEYSSTEDYFGSYKLLHVNGRLAFHAPKIGSKIDAELNTENVEALFNVALDAVGVFLKMTSRGQIKLSLVISAMNARGADWIEVDTVHEAGLWGIDLLGVTYPRLLTSQAAVDACTNVSNWSTQDNPFHGDSEDYVVAPEPKYTYDWWEDSRVTKDENGLFDIMLTDGLYGYTCSIFGETLDDSFNDPIPERRYIAVKVADESQQVFLSCEDVGSANCPAHPIANLNGLAYYTALAMFPANARLSELISLPERNDGKGETSGSLAADAIDLRFEQCWLQGKDGTARIANVTDYVNLRDGPNQSASILRRLALGDLVSVISSDGITFRGDEPAAQACITACQSVWNGTENSSDRERIAECINDNTLWYSVVDSQGNRGWLSRKFLKELN